MKLSKEVLSMALSEFRWARAHKANGDMGLYDVWLRRAKHGLKYSRLLARHGL